MNRTAWLQDRRMETDTEGRLRPLSGQFAPVSGWGRTPIQIRSTPDSDREFEAHLLDAKCQQPT